MEIKYSGINTATPDNAATDGTLSEAINLVNEDGALHPVEQPYLIADFSTGPRPVAMHTTPQYSHFILYDGEHLAYADRNAIDLPKPIADLQGLLSFRSVGNILIGFRHSDMQYFVFRNGQYDVLGNHIPEIPLSLGLTGHPSAYSLCAKSETDSSCNGLKYHVFGVPMPRRLVWAGTAMDSTEYDEFWQKDSDGNPKRSTSNNITTFTNAVLGVLNKFINDTATRPGRFVLPFFLRYAVRLFDNSLVCHSAPILLNPGTTTGPVVTVSLFGQNLSADAQFPIDNSQLKPEGDIFVRAANIDCFGVPSDIDYAFTTPNPAALEPWRDIIKSVDIFITPAIYPYKADSEITRIAEWWDGSKSQFNGRLDFDNLHNNSYYNTRLDQLQLFDPAAEANNRAYASYPYDALMYLTGINNSDTVCSSFNADKTPGPSIDSKSIPWIVTPFDRRPRTGGGRENLTVQRVPLAAKDQTELRETYRNSYNFYKLAEIPFDDLLDQMRQNPAERHTIEIETGYLQSLEQQELLPDDYRSHDTISAEASLTYNSRLNIAAIRRTLFPGYAPDTMFQYLNTRLEAHDDGIVPLLPDGTANPYAYAHRGHYSFNTSTHTHVIETTVELDNSTYRLSARSSLPLTSFLSTTPTEGLSFFCYFFYPDNGARHMTLFEDGSAVARIDLKEHEFLNGAHHRIDYNTPHNTSRYSFPTATAPLGLKPMPQGRPIATLTPDFSPKTVYYPNLLETSNVINPFLFPLNNINRVGSGRIIGLATAELPLSQGQFGTSPLYTFATDGIWALSTTTTGGWSAIQPLAQDVCTSASSITPLDNGVLFATDRGLMLAAGISVRPISDAILRRQHTPGDTMPKMDKLLSAYTSLPPQALRTTRFADYLARAVILYNYPMQRILVSSPDYPTAYLYSLKSGEWTQQNISLVTALNSYPEALAVDKNGHLLSLSKHTENVLPGIVVTRPFHLGDPNLLKTIGTILQRGVLHRDHVLQALYATRDYANYNLVSSSAAATLRHFSGTPFKAYRLAIITNLLPTESLSGCTINAVDKYNNKAR